jgi:hypothetical protein
LFTAGFLPENLILLRASRMGAARYPIPTIKKLQKMVFDLDLIKKVYGELPAKVDAAKKMLGRPMTLAEKILYSHSGMRDEG